MYLPEYCRVIAILAQLFNVRFGSLAVIHDPISLMSAVGCKADVRLPANPRNCRPLSAKSPLNAVVVLDTSIAELGDVCHSLWGGVDGESPVRNVESPSI